MGFFKYNNKNVYYNKYGKGEPVIFLHGNTASSKMFDPIIPLYTDQFEVIVIDFLGHGKSERLDKFADDFWYDEGLQVIELIKHLGYSKVNLVGASGGAIAAVNVALESPDLINKVIADSFEGEVPLAGFVENIKMDREMSKNIPQVQGFYKFNHGEEWESVIDNDTNAIIEHYKNIGKYYHRSLEELKVPILLTGSREDDFFKGDFFENTYNSMLKKIEEGEKHIFTKGGHPSIISNSKEFFELAMKFLIS